MKKEYKIIDNFLTKEIFSNIKNLLMSSDFVWHYNANVSQNNRNDGFYFTHTVFKDNLVYSNKFNLFVPILKKLKIKSLIRIKINLYTKTDEIIEHGQHVDYEFKHKGFIFYINTNNGFTRLTDGTKVESIENRGLFFNSNKKHNSSTCNDENRRVNINFNYF